MKLTVLGVTGGTGQQLARQAIAAGHEVTAIVRRPDAIPAPGQLRVVRGDLLDPQWTGEGIDGAEAVLSALGATARGPTTLYSAGTAAVLKAMDDAGVRRILVVSASPAGPDDQKSGFNKVVVFPILWKFFGGSYEDMRRIEQILAASDTDWTVFRPPRLTNGRLTGHARTAIGKPLPNGRVVSRADLAAAMLAAIDDRATVRQAVAIAR